MRWLILLLVTLASTLHLAYAAADEISLKVPPTSLAQWYKPENKRQVWLHTMFKLRREMQAMRQYAEQENAVAMEKWLSNFAKHYKSLSTMVPQWRKKIQPQRITELRQYMRNKEFYQVALTLNKITESCDACHEDYRAQVRVIYRSADFSDVKINDVDGQPQNIENNMQDLSLTVNRILIALVDAQYQFAQSAAQNLQQQLKNLSTICQGCHKNDDISQQRILGKITRDKLNKLQKNISLLESLAGSKPSNKQRNMSAAMIKDSQQLMGELAVGVCARCHNTHRSMMDFRKLFKPHK